MDITLSPTSRKRRHTESTHSNSDDDTNYPKPHPIEEDDLPSKRLRNPQGNPTTIPQLHLATHSLLYSLAFTRLDVTANYTNYNPLTSPMMICVTREDDKLYRKLW